MESGNFQFTRSSWNISNYH